MRVLAGFFGAIAAALCGCGGHVEVSSTTGGGDGGAATSSAGGAGGTTAVGGTTTTFTTSSTTTTDDGCPGAPPDAFWVDVQIGMEQFHLTAACPYSNGPHGPVAYATTNGKSGPAWYFVLVACKEGVPEGSIEGPSIQMKADIPESAMLSTPYDTVGDIVYTTSSQDQLAPAMSPSIVFNQFGAVHGIVTGKFSGSVVWTDGQTVSAYGSFSVCRRSDVISI